MHQRISKKIVIYLFLFIILVTVNNINFLNFSLPQISNLEISGLNDFEKEEFKNDFDFLKNKNIISLDKDKTQCATLAFLANDQNKNFELYFANGGDQNNDSIPEVSICKKLGIGLIENLGDKIQSSSWLLKESDE